MQTKSTTLIRKDEKFKRTVNRGETTVYCGSAREMEGKTGDFSKTKRKVEIVRWNQSMKESGDWGREGTLKEIKEVTTSIYNL